MKKAIAWTIISATALGILLMVCTTLVQNPHIFIALGGCGIFVAVLSWALMAVTE